MRLYFGIAGMLLLLVAILVVTYAQEGFENVNNRVVSGRYIRLEQKQAGCINLAEIEVFSSQDGPNIIKPTTVVTKSSSYGTNDEYPSKNFVDGNKDTMIVTSCKDAGWILVDLGSVLPIFKIIITNRKDCCRERATGIILSILDNKQSVIYTANPTRDKSGKTTWVEGSGTMNDYYYTFTYFPPYPVAFGDLPNSMTMDPPSYIDSARGWSRINPIEDPVPMYTNETAESCRQMALKSDRYVAFGYRKDNHPTDWYRNTCYLYKNDFKPYFDDVGDDIHITGCLREGEKLELGCKAPSDPKTYEQSDKIRCRTLSTAFNDEGGGNAVYLDRHDVKCEPNEVLGQFRLIREGGNPPRYRYNYSCCKSISPTLPDVTLPPNLKDAPEKIIALQNEISGIKSQIPAGVREAPARLTELQTQLKSLQEQVQKASVLPADIKDAPSKVAVLESNLKRLQEQLPTNIKDAPATLAVLKNDIKQIQDTLPSDIKNASSKLSSLQVQIKQIQDTLPSDIKDAPSKLSSLQTEVKRIQEQLQKPDERLLTPELKQAPTKLASLEADIKRIQEQLQRITITSGPATPQRIDITPETKLSDTAIQAAQLSQGTSFLADLQKIIRNEVLAQRSTTPLNDSISG